MLLKTILAAPGMTKQGMFQVIDPNVTQMCVIATFQKADREIIDQQKGTFGKFYEIFTCF
jgi:hypothetical protein